jgi:hypothetical protein
MLVHVSPPEHGGGRLWTIDIEQRPNQASIDPVLLHE